MIMDDLIHIRKEIDAIDDALFDLLRKRLSLATLVGKEKVSRGQEIIDPKREEEILSRLQKKALEEMISQSFITSLWKTIFKESREVQKKS